MVDPYKKYWDELLGLVKKAPVHIEPQLYIPTYMSKYIKELDPEYQKQQDKDREFMDRAIKKAMKIYNKQTKWNGIRNLTTISKDLPNSFSKD